MNPPSEAICPKGALHRWTESQEFHDAYVEICEQCSKRMIWRKDEFGRMDNRKYSRAHIRSFAQPTGPTAKIFAMAYGEDVYRRAIKKRITTKVNWDRAMDDARGYLRELNKEKAAI